MDPIGFALENFDAIGLWRTQDEGQPVDPTTQVFDNSKVSSPLELRAWLVNNYDRQFVTVSAEKLLTYALGRGAEYRDMPLVRSVAREAEKNNNRLSALVMAIVKSQPFQMNTKGESAPAPASTASLSTSTDKGVN
jgi:hypothetical protein